MNERRPVVLDVDTGIDDAWALYYALTSPTLEVLGITTGFGNAEVEVTTRNTLLMVDLLGRDVPVYAGAARPLLRPWMGPVPEYHGDNGLGNVSLPEPKSHARSRDASAYLRDVIRERPGQVTLITVARLTNLARALLYDPDLAALIPRVVMMGGAAFVPGNITATAEANIWGDPEAADIVFQSGIPITMIGLDVTMQARLTQDDLNLWSHSDPHATLLKRATAFYIRAYERDDATIRGWCPIHDPLAVAVAEDPTLVTTVRYPVRVETRGHLTDGMTVVDGRRPDSAQGADVAVAVDADRFLTQFRARLLQP